MIAAITVEGLLDDGHATAEFERITPKITVHILDLISLRPRNRTAYRDHDLTPCSPR